MRRTLLTVMGVLLAIAPLPVEAQVSLGQSSSNVTYIGTVPFEAGTWSTARVYKGHLYVGGTKSFSIYDISDPTAPELVSLTPTGVQFVNEDLDTNGKILLMSDEKVGRRLLVYDVEDKANPVKLAELTDMGDHTYGCVLDCRWAYGAGGSIVDLRKPSQPKVAGRWTRGFPTFWGFDTNEYAPGRVITGSKTIHMLDARANPTKPKVRALGPTRDDRVIHSTRWPRLGRDRILLVQGETSPKPQCDERSGAFMTWDASRWRKTHTFTMIDEFRVPSGTIVDGNPPASALGCSPSWFQEHPSFRNGGLVVSGFFDHGARFLDISPKGEIEQVGYYTPIGGSVTGTYWITKDIVYAVDIVHGIDILRFDRKA